MIKDRPSLGAVVIQTKDHFSNRKASKQKGHPKHKVSRTNIVFDMNKNGQVVTPRSKNADLTTPRAADGGHDGQNLNF